MFVGEFTTTVFYLNFDGVCDSFHLISAARFTYDEEVGYSFGYFAEVQGNNIFTLFPLDRMDDGLKNLRIPR